MTFNSYEFFALFGVVLALYWTLPARFRVPLLLATSYLFYGWWNWRFLFLIVASTAVDYQVARMVAATDDPVRRKRLLLISIAVNLVILGSFKYFNFFLGSFETVLQRIGFSGTDWALRVALPVGISFYTFQSMAYTIDVYRRRLEPCADPLVFATYVSFFPQLVAGPIERAERLLPQIADLPRRVPAVMVREGLDLILIGLFKKIAIADVVQRVVTDAFTNTTSSADGVLVFPAPDSWTTLAMGVAAFAIGAYGDFSGYSDIARGTAKLLGIDLMRNFTQPFRSHGQAEFWRRWHASLMNWFRDYVYIPLGGNRGGTWRRSRNVLIVFTLSGLWHGATWNFVIWGFLVGVLVLSEDLIRRRFNRPPPPPYDLAPGGARHAAVLNDGAISWPAVRGVAARATGRVWVFVAFAAPMVFFRANSFDQAMDVWHGLFTLAPGPINTAHVLTLVYAFVAVIVIDRHLLSLDHLEDARRLRAGELVSASAVSFDASGAVARSGDELWHDDDAHVEHAFNRPGGFLGRHRSIAATWRWHVRDGLIIVAIIIFSGGMPEPFLYFQF
ncbi:MAG: MBOAT family protein [Actinobacteria bacterium]|nr:MBOAT family protein [Actinomycetota bacterium]MCB9390727.1 MBOAT family protein [Acidimicrobiia bacterium]